MPQLPVLNNLRSIPRRAPNAIDAGGISGSGGPIGDAERERLAADLVSLLRTGSGPDGAGGEVRFGVHDRLLYATDASLYQVEPIGVVVPASTDDAVRVVRYCAERGVAMLPRGGGTSLAGQCTNHAVVIDLTPGCRRLISVDAATKTCTVEPGIGIDELNDQLARLNTGLFFAPDPATTRQAAIGGCLGNNAAGGRSIRYGRTSENVERIEVQLATGERLWLGPGAGLRNQTARRLGEGVLHLVRANAERIRRLFPRTIRRNAGYGLDMILDQAEAGATAESVDLAKLLCGSEGTLAVTLGAELKLHPLPKAKGIAVVSFASLEDAIEATKPIIDHCRGLGLTAIELLDDVVLDAARGNLQYRSYVDLLPGANSARSEPKAVLYVEFFGFDGGKAEVEAGFAALKDLMSRTTGVIPGGIAAYTDAGAMLKAWALRKAGEPLLHGLPGNRKPQTFVEDNAVPVERLTEFVREFKKIVAKHGTRAAYWAHASVGVLHVRPMIDLHDPEDRARMRAIAVEVADLARSVGGIMSGEHGDGRVRGPLLERFFGPELMHAFREVKNLFDPAGLLNPGNIVRPGPLESMTANLRVDAESSPVRERRAGGHTGAEENASRHGPGSRAPGAQASEAHAITPVVRRDPETFFDYSSAHGFMHAVEQCNGAGVCRKRGGVMCPSYHATLDERHSTRGRGNALRLAITGQFPSGASGPGWSDAETIKTLDLCLSCKACKSECPSNVDIAKLKAEFTAQRHRLAGHVPLKARVFGHVRTLNRLGSITPGLANRFNRTRLAKWMAERLLGIDQRRSIPAFAGSLHLQARSDAGVVAAMKRPGAPKVVLFADCFTTFNEPRIGVAALRVLAALGYEVEILPGRKDDGILGPHAGLSGCCGRAMISTGLLGDAAATMDATVELLRPAIEDPRVVAVVACEPSCLSAFKDDWLELKGNSPLELRRSLATKAQLVEEFVDRAWDSHPIPPRPAPATTTPVLLHGHCHQKSLWGAETSARALRRLLGDRLQVLDTGCCGMAGSFGFTTDRYDLSMRIGELSLFPAVRSASPGATICAPGTSCRHQIHDGVSREALHPIELIERLLA